MINKQNTIPTGIPYVNAIIVLRISGQYLTLQINLTSSISLKTLYLIFDRLLFAALHLFFSEVHSTPCL